MPEAGSRMSTRNAVIGVIVALGAFPMIVVFKRLGISTQSIWFGVAMKWAIGLGVLAWAMGVEGLSLATLGVKRPRPGTFGWAFLGVVATFVSMGVYYRLVAPLFGPVTAPARVGMLAGLPMILILIVSASAGLVEELVFRFYAISRLHRLTGNRWIASLIPVIVFVGLHVPGFGLGQAVPVALGATVLTLLFWLRRDFWCNALAHLLVDFSAFAAIALSMHPGR